jgi:hypothetical protein
MDGPVILIASNDKSAVETVRCAIAGEFANILVAAPPRSTVEVSDRHRSEVLILAFSSMEFAEQHYFGLFRRSREIRRNSHRTLVLCGRKAVPKAHDRRRMEIFDGYVPFWPSPLDEFQLSMVAQHALRNLAAMEDGGSDSAELAVYTRRDLDLETLLKTRMREGNQCVAPAGQALSLTGEEIRIVLEGFSKGMAIRPLGNTRRCPLTLRPFAIQGTHSDSRYGQHSSEIHSSRPSLWASLSSRSTP